MLKVKALATVADGVVRVRMNFQDQRVRAGGDRGLAHGRHVFAVAGAVGRIGDDGQVAGLLQHRHGVEVERVARGGFIGANAALADHDVVVAVAHDVLGAHQQFLDGAADAALEHDGALHLADGMQQSEVLHVARADLQNVGVFGDHRQGLDGHDLGDDGQAGDFACFGQVFKTLETQALEAVWAGARLEGAAAQHLCAGGLDGLGGLDEFVAILDAARTGHDDDLFTADAKLPVADLDDGIVGTRGAAGELVRLLDANGVLHAVHGGEGLAADLGQVADQGDDGTVLAVDGMGAHAHALGLADDGADFSGGALGVS